MAGERNLPGLGLLGFWNLGSEFKVGMDANLLLLSVVAGGTVDSRAAAAPGTPTDGDIHIATTDWGATVTAQSVQVRDNGAWVEVAAYEGLTMYDKATDEPLIFNGTVWNVVASGGGGGSPFSPSTETASFDVSDSMLAGGVHKRAISASTITITVPPSLTGTQPLTVSRGGAGAVTFAPGAGVTILSADARLSLRVTHSTAALMPLGSDTFLLSGDIA